MTPLFLAECYRPGTSPGWLDAASRAIDREGGASVTRCVEAILVPEDNVAFFLLEGPSLEAVRAVVGEAGIIVDRLALSERATLGDWRNTTG